MAEALEMVHMGGRRLVQGLWWPVGPKLVSDQMATPVPEIMDILCLNLLCIDRLKPQLSTIAIWIIKSNS
jgi:hypothetical protein